MYEAHENASRSLCTARYETPLAVKHKEKKTLPDHEMASLPLKHLQYGFTVTVEAEVNASESVPVV